MTRQPSGYEKHKDKSKKPTGYSSLEGKLTLNKLELQVKFWKSLYTGQILPSLQIRSARADQRFKRRRKIRHQPL